MGQSSPRRRNNPGPNQPVRSASLATSVNKFREPTARGRARLHPPSHRKPQRPIQQPFKAPETPNDASAPIANSFRNKKVLRVMAVGGCEEIGRNMYLLEYGTDIIVIDAGIQFPEEDMYGIDFIIPNTEYLESKVKNIRGVILTHGHFDHIGAIPYVIHKIGSPPVFGMPLTLALVAKRQEDFAEQPKLNLNPITTDSRLQLGVFTVEFFRVCHSIPDSTGLLITTPEGKVVFTADYKMDPTPHGTQPAEMKKIESLAKQNILLHMTESTHPEEQDHSRSELDVEKTLHEIIADAKGRLIVAIFSTVLVRIQQLLWAAEKYNRKVIIEGFSLKAMVEIAKNLGYLKYKKDTIVLVQEGLKLPNNRIIIICTGNQGQDRAALPRIANQEHRFIKFEKNDVVIFSSSIIPGNERSIQRLKDVIARQGTEIVHSDLMDVHASGHGHAEDMKEMIRFVKPRYFMPIHGSHYKLRRQAKLAVEVGVPPENIFVADNGQVIEFLNGKAHLTQERVNTDYVFIDGLGVGDVSQIVMRDRQQLGADGMLVVIATIIGRSGKLSHNPDLITRGFVYIKENKEFIEEIRQRVKKIVQSRDHSLPANESYLKEQIRNELGEFIFYKTERRPMILPVVIEV